MIRTMVLALACLSLGPALSAQPTTDPQRSVLQIRCISQGGETRATGFVWPEPGYMVTALHAVAGCENGVIFSESAGDDTRIAEIVAVDLEPDLALIRLADDMGVPALTLADGPPNEAGPHVIWGYPVAAVKMTRDDVRFSIGLSGLLTTLGGAYAHEDLQRLYRSQDFPTRDTQIFRVASLLQHGQSGAPILDAEGRVVAIADGGLLGGWRGMNWSIPAHVYLPGLPASEDVVPQDAARQALLMNSFAVREETVVPLGDPTAAIEAAKQDDAASSAAPVGFETGGLLALGAVQEDLKTVYNEVDWIFKDLEEHVPAADWKDVPFEVLVDEKADRWIFAPSRTANSFDADTGTLTAVSVDGNAAFAHVHVEAESFDAALREGAARLQQEISGLPAADLLPRLPYADQVDHVLEYVNQYDYGEFEDGRVGFFIEVQINGPVFSGRVVVRSEYEDDMSDAGWVDYQMMLLAADGLIDLASYYDPFPSVEWLGDTARDPAPSELTLVRRVPLAEVARFFVEDQDFAWKRDVAALRAALPDPDDFDELRFDVYEDRASGATVAVPQGTELVWNPDLGAVEGRAAGGRVHLAVAVHSAATFEAVTGENVVQFIDALSEMADWDNLSPADCQPDISQAAQRADCWASYSGDDRATGERAELHLGLTALDNVFLGTSVYLRGAETSLMGQDLVDYLMMLIGAEYLSDFAVR